MHVVLLVVYGFEIARNWNNNRSNIHFPSLQLPFHPGRNCFQANGKVQETTEVANKELGNKQTKWLEK